MPLKGLMTKYVISDVVSTSKAGGRGVRSKGRNIKDAIITQGSLGRPQERDDAKF